MEHEDISDEEIIPTTSLPIRPVPKEALEVEESGGFWDLLQELDVTLAVSREQENFLLLLGRAAGQAPWQSTMVIDQPTGLFLDPSDGHLLVGTTRSPNQLLSFRPMAPGTGDSLILPPDNDLPDRDTIYVPAQGRFLPGTLYIHDVVRMDGDLIVVATDHNFVARVSPQGGWERVWWPRVLDEVGEDRFRINRMQLNSIAAGESLADSYFTAFSDVVDGPKPWRRGYGPDKRGVVLSGASRETVLRGLTCPHSVRRREGRLWLCNSGYGELGRAALQENGDLGAWEPVVRLPGFVRGLCFVGDIAFVGLSKVLESYEAYAPGVPARDSRCGLSAVDCRSGNVVAEIRWPAGHEVYDIVALPGPAATGGRRVLPEITGASDGAETDVSAGPLRYLL